MIRTAPLLLALAGCAATAAPEPALPPDGKCDIAPLQRLVGQPATADLAVEAQRLSAARAVRWKAPGMAVTMDYRPDRLNIEIDAAQKVVGFDCG